MFKRLLFSGCVLCLAILTGCAAGSSRILTSSDSDADGIVRRLDRCPDTPAGIAVDVNGCPADSDGDGVFDRLDRCPGTEIGQVVDLHGCNVDRDNDGVFDWRDHCPRSRAAGVVGLDGCAPEVAVAAADIPAAPVDRKLVIYFESDQSLVLPEFRTLVEKLALALVPQQVERITVSGHADDTGSEAYNLRLGAQRARRVTALLAAEAPQLASRLTMRSFGETRPVADNSTALGRLLNRRVEIRVEMAAGQPVGSPVR
ncbi:OmpA family protein [Geothermobacter hydrogeniphilus]|uniref:OmpA-like domain-containing protein n=1 Tax=Geothermobacter hydrogeniphilus TaxID=1969733 RepID=A0A1X0XWA2_9BACT|nr:OmpA family protein [Geothermobacter hydrogeniphilus]ORJ57118.1 hypothetical protein B5V00_14385 [Geothermobacter hydrogeniphilus]